jgi:hypothetical protein
MMVPSRYSFVGLRMTPWEGMIFQAAWLAAAFCLISAPPIKNPRREDRARGFA